MAASPVPGSPSLCGASIGYARIRIREEEGVEAQRTAPNAAHRQYRIGLNPIQASRPRTRMAVPQSGLTRPIGDLRIPEWLCAVIATDQ